MPVKPRENSKPPAAPQPRRRPAMTDARLEAVVEAAYVLAARTR